MRMSQAGVGWAASESVVGRAAGGYMPGIQPMVGLAVRGGGLERDGVEGVPGVAGPGRLRPGARGAGVLPGDPGTEGVPVGTGVSGESGRPASSTLAGLVVISRSRDGE
ncbi:hypothetical protein Ntsu_55400 [Nocardia sp. IFM 10818]